MIEELESLTEKTFKHIDRKLGCGKFDRVKLKQIQSDLQRGLVKDSIKPISTDDGFSKKEILKKIKENNYLDESEILNKEFRRKILNKLKLKYISCQKSGKLVKLNLATLNSYLLYQNYLADSKVFYRSKKIAYELSQLKQKPHLLLLQEVFPQDTNLINDHRFLWPNSNDWPSSDLEIIRQSLNQHLKYFPMMVEQKQRFGKFSTIGNTFKSFINQGYHNNIFKSTEVNPFNPGPTGLANGLSQTITELNLKNKKEASEIKIKNLGHYFSNYQGGHYNKLIPLSRGVLTSLFEIEGWGKIEFSNTHLTTDEFNFGNRVYQLSHFFNEREIRIKQTQKYIQKHLTNFQNLVCTFLSAEKKVLEKFQQFCEKKNIELKQFKELASKARKGSSFQNDLNTLITYFSHLKSYQNSPPIISIFGGDFNFQPQFLLKNYSQVGYQYLVNEKNLFVDRDGHSKITPSSTYDTQNNPIVLESNTSMARQIERIFDQLAQGANLSKKDAQELKNKLGIGRETEEASTHKIDYLTITDYDSNVVWAINKSEVLFNGTNGDFVSDHYGLATELWLWKEK